MNYRIEVFNKETDEHIENVDFESDSEETAIDELEELATLPAGESIDQDGYKYELQLWRQSDSREHPDELIETGFTNEYTDHREFYCVWQQPEYEELKTEVNFIDFFSADNGYSGKDFERINSLEKLDFIRFSSGHAIIRIS